MQHDRFFLDRICARILACVGKPDMEWHRDNYEENNKRHLGPDAPESMKVRHKTFVR